MIKVITGGQTGVDTGAALAARTEKFDTRCIMPAGYKREEPAPDWLKGITTCLKTTNYAVRTKTVMAQAVAVLVIEPDGNKSPGTKLTVDLAKEQGKHLWRFMHIGDRAIWKAEQHAIAYWLRSLEHLYGEVTLMVAGPRAGKWAEAHDCAFIITQNLLQAIRGDAAPSARLPKLGPEPLKTKKGKSR